MILGWIFVRPIPLPIQNGVNTVEDGSSPRRSSFEGASDSATRLLPDGEFGYDETYVRSPKQRARGVSITSYGEVGTSTPSENELPDISGKELFMNPRFWLLFSITSLRESPNIRHKSGH